MSTYPAAARRGDSPNSSPRTARIELFIIHHYAGFTPPDQAFARFMTANDRDVCPTWQVNADGSVFECMDPDRRRPWTSGAVDNRAVTVETQNVTGPPGWLCSDASHEAIAALVAFAHARWGIPLDRAHVIGHREAPGAYATACPGGINLDWIVNRAIQLTTSENGSEMYIISSPNRPATLVGPGYVATLTAEESTNIGAIVSKSTVVNDRQFDLAISAAQRGVVSAPQIGPYIIVSPNRPRALVDVGFFRVLNGTEEPAVAAYFGPTRVLNVNDRQYDLARSIAIQ
jgi:hypothetical protein